MALQFYNKRTGKVVLKGKFLTPPGQDHVEELKTIVLKSNINFGKQVMPVNFTWFLGD
jgi:hypothetical protein